MKNPKASKSIRCHFLQYEPKASKGENGDCQRGLLPSKWPLPRWLRVTGALVSGPFRPLMLLKKYLNIISKFGSISFCYFSHCHCIGRLCPLVQLLHVLVVAHSSIQFVIHVNSNDLHMNEKVDKCAQDYIKLIYWGRWSSAHCCLLIALYLHHHCLYRFMIVVHQLYHIRIKYNVQVLGVTVDCTLAARSTQATVLILLSP